MLNVFGGGKALSWYAALPPSSYSLVIVLVMLEEADVFLLVGFFFPPAVWSLAEWGPGNIWKVPADTENDPATEL